MANKWFCFRGWFGVNQEKKREWSDRGISVRGICMPSTFLWCSNWISKFPKTFFHHFPKLVRYNITILWLETVSLMLAGNLFLVLLYVQCCFISHAGGSCDYSCGPHAVCLVCGLGTTQYSLLCILGSLC